MIAVTPEKATKTGKEDEMPKKPGYERDGDTISNGKLVRRGAPIRVSADGVCIHPNPRVEWLANELAQGGMRYSTVLQCWTIDSAHRIRGRAYHSDCE